VPYDVDLRVSSAVPHSQVSNSPTFSHHGLTSSFQSFRQPAGQTTSATAVLFRVGAAQTRTFQTTASTNARQQTPTRPVRHARHPNRCPEQGGEEYRLPRTSRYQHFVNANASRRTSARHGRGRWIRVDGQTERRRQRHSEYRQRCGKAPSTQLVHQNGRTRTR
jgi:hypothetical protein